MIIIGLSVIKLIAIPFCFLWIKVSRKKKTEKLHLQQQCAILTLTVGISLHETYALSLIHVDK